MAQVQEYTCGSEAETADRADVVPDLHWCNLEEGHGGLHLCSCGLEWTEEAPC